MTKKTKIILLVAIAILILGIALYPRLKKQFSATAEVEITEVKKTASASQALSVNAKIMKFEPLQDVYQTVGKLIPDEEVNLSFETAGKITQIYFNEGTFVKKGTLLAKLNDEPLQAELKKLEAQIPLYESRVFRQKSLLDKDAVSLEAYESVTTELEKLHADIELVKARIAQSELRAPFDGQIGLRFVSEGTYAGTTTMVSTLTKITPLKLEFTVTEALANDIRAGLDVEFTTRNDFQQKYNAKIYAVETRLEEQTLTLKARALYNNADGRLKPGTSTNIRIIMNEQSDALLIPSIAFVAEMGRSIAYVYKNGVAQQVVIERGMRTQSAVQALAGVNEGDTLITSGVMQLRDGMPVKIAALTE